MAENECFVPGGGKIRLKDCKNRSTRKGKESSARFFNPAFPAVQPRRAVISIE